MVVLEGLWCASQLFLYLYRSSIGKSAEHCYLVFTVEGALNEVPGTGPAQKNPAGMFDIFVVALTWALECTIG